ncbi:YciI family protein [Paenibacillus septentrionalis]|uniref:YciI family protein n=1 Tax=Paenibacillus septentrionalis TaxID=429342 RepID=A0ABW1V5S1_9BACL
MRFILMVNATEYSEAGVYHSNDFIREMIAYKKVLTEAGVLLAAEEIQPSSTGIKITHLSCGKEPELRAGPFPVEQALISKYFLIEAESETEALNWALRMPIQKEFGEVTIEMRRIEEMFNSKKSSRLRAMEADLADQLTMLRESR